MDVSPSQIAHLLLGTLRRVTCCIKEIDYFIDRTIDTSTYSIILSSLHTFKTLFIITGKNWNAFFYSHVCLALHLMQKNYVINQNGKIHLYLCISLNL